MIKIEIEFDKEVIYDVLSNYLVIGEANWIAHLPITEQFVVYCEIFSSLRKDLLASLYVHGFNDKGLNEELIEELDEEYVKKIINNLKNK